MRLTTHIGKYWIARTVQTGPKNYLTTAAIRHEQGTIKIVFQYPTYTENEARRTHRDACTYIETYGVSYGKDM